MAFDGFSFGLSLWQIILCIFIISLPLMYQRSNTCKYYIKLTVYYTSALMSGVVVVCYSIFRPRNWRNQIFVRWTCKYFLSPVFGLELVTRGMEHFQLDQAAIVVVNHQSSIDLIPLFANWPDSLVCLAKKELLWCTGSFGFAAWLCGTVYINRGNSAGARKTMDDTMNRIKTEKLKVLVFPEGTRNHKGSMLPFKKGAFHIAVQAQVPIIPVVLSSYQGFYSKLEKRFDQGKIVIEALPPIPTAGLTVEDVTSLTDKTREAMLTCFDRISLEANAPQTFPSSSS